MRGNDVTLIQRTLEGDQNAFTALVNKYQKWVHTLVWRKIGDFHIAEEITQDVFLKVYKKLSTLKPPEQFPGWLYVITTRHCIAWLRKKRQPTSSLDAMPAPELEELCYAQYEASRGEATAVERQREIIKQLLQKLPESERTVVTLHYLAEMSCEEISEFLGVSPNTVKSRLHRARKRLETQEHLLHDVSGIFRLPPTLTENIMREVARLKPPTPSVSKPWLPWGASLASAILIMLMIGFGARALYRFQQPYNLDAESEMVIELVEAPIVLPLRLKPDVKTQLGSTNAVGRSSSTSSRTNGQPLVAVPSEAVEVLDTEPQWIQSEKLTGGDVKNLFLTSEKVLYAVGSTGLYRLTDDNSTGWTLVNASLPLTSQSEPMAEWGETLYIATQTNLFASTDRGVTWHVVGPRPRGRAIALLITDPNKVRRPRDAQINMYLVLANGVFRSIDAGSTWHAFNDGLTAPEIQDAVAVGNVLFLGTRQGLYRLNSGVWEKLPVAQSQSIDSLAVADNKIYFSAEKRENQQFGSLFASDDFGESWIDITPASHGLESSPFAIGSAKLVAVGETVLALGTGVLRSTDAGNTWEYLGFDRHASTLGIYPAVALDENTVFVAGMPGSIGRSIDGGATWHPFMTGITELRVLDLAQVNDVLYALTDKGIAKSTDGGELWTYIGTGLPPSLGKPLNTLKLSNLTAVGSALYVRAKQGGSTNSLFHLLPNTDTLLHIKDMPVYVDSSRSKWLESIAYTTGTLDLDETDQANLFRYQLGIEEAATRTTGEFAVSGNTFYIEYERRLYRWTHGHRKWHDLGMQDAPVFADFYATDGFQFAVSGEVIYLGKSNGTLLQSLDSGDTWRDVTANFPFPLNKAGSRDELLKKLPHFKEIVFSGSTVYVSTSNGVVMSSDDDNGCVKILLGCILGCRCCDLSRSVVSFPKSKTLMCYRRGYLMDILSVISQEVKSIFSEVVNDVSVPAETLEVEVLRASRELGRKVLEACFSAKASAVASPAPVCQKCSGELVGFQQRQRYVETLCGVVRISRWVYRCECGSYGVPWDAEVGLKAGCTIGVRKAMCRLSARLDFREACEELWHQGLRVSHTRLQQKVQEWSEGERVSDSVDEQALEVGSRWYVSADGCHTPAQDGTYSEVKVGCVYRDYPQLGPGSIASARSSSLRYVASRSDAVSFGEQWFALATASGIYHKETPDEEIVVIGDGAAWIWNLSEQYFPGATEIVDYMHAKSHLYDIAKQAFGETSPETIERWVKTMETSLDSGDTQDLVAGIRALGVGIPALSEALETEVGYFQKHAKRMQYQTFVENGYHIGSGLIESACKHVVAQRCKQASMKWSKPGIDAVLFWRCLLKNGAWDEFWDKQAKTA